MKKIIVRGGALLAIMLALATCQGCFKLQRAIGCNNTGIFGCKDEPPEPSEIQPTDSELRRAPPGGRSQWVPIDDGRYLEGQEYPWSRPLDDCMATRTRTECFENLPPDLLAQFEVWEAEQAAMRRQQTMRGRQRLDPAFGVEPNDP